MKKMLVAISMLLLSACNFSAGADVTQTGSYVPGSEDDILQEEGEVGSKYMLVISTAYDGSSATTVVPVPFSEAADCVASAKYANQRKLHRVSAFCLLIPPARP